MIYPVHHIPGRLRIKSPYIKGNHRAAAALRRRIGAIAGVESVEVNSLTGSAVIEYRQDTVTGLGILHQLDGGRYGPGQEIRLVPQYGAPAAASQVLAEKFLGTVAQTLAERSAAALLAALI